MIYNRRVCTHFFPKHAVTTLIATDLGRSRRASCKDQMRSVLAPLQSMARLIVGLSRYSGMSCALYLTVTPRAFAKRTTQKTQQRGTQTKWIQHTSTQNMAETLWHYYHDNVNGCAMSPCILEASIKLISTVLALVVFARRVGPSLSLI